MFARYRWDWARSRGDCARPRASACEYVKVRTDPWRLSVGDVLDCERQLIRCIKFAELVLLTTFFDSFDARSKF